MFEAASYPPSSAGILSEHIMYESFARMPVHGLAGLDARRRATFGNIRNPLIKNAMNAPARPYRRPASTTVQELKARLAVFGDRVPAGAGALGFGIAAIDAALPGHGLARHALHEIAGADGDASAAGFATALLARLAVDGPVLWIARRPDLNAAGLAELGLEPARLLVVNAPRRADALWAFEEALRNPALAGAVAEIDDVDLTQSRRLQLAAEAGRTTALLLRPPSELALASAARTRWHVSAEPAGTAATSADGAARRWLLRLARAQGGGPGEWRVEHRRDGWTLADAARPALSRDLPAAPADRPVRAAG